jgi:uncharacterized protein YgiB involved in biofilm formation
MVAPVASRALRLFVIALGCGLFVACGSEPRDGDEDGFDTVADCNDANAAIHPDAAESCTDGLDNDCDLAVDDADPDCGAGS